MRVKNCRSFTQLWKPIQIEFNVDQIVAHQQYNFGRLYLHEPCKCLSDLFQQEQLERWIFLSGLHQPWKLGPKCKVCHSNRFPWFRFWKHHNVQGELLSIIAANEGFVSIGSVSTTKASYSRFCSTSTSTNSNAISFLAQRTHLPHHRCHPLTLTRWTA